MYEFNATPGFQRGAVRPVVCLQSGFDLIKDQYWLVLGIALVATLIGAFSCGILMGTMYCGVFLVMFALMRREPIQFDMLFRGFDFLTPSVIAILLVMVASFAIQLPFISINFVAAMITEGAARNDATALAVVMSLLRFVVGLVGYAVALAVQALVIFVFPLIVDRKLDAIEALKLSVQAGLANIWGLLGLIFLGALLSILGVLLCCVGSFLVIPIVMASHAVAYRQVFPNAPPPQWQAQAPPPPYGQPY